MQLELLTLETGESVADVEEWREVVGFPRYEVSTFGRFRNKATGKFAPGTLAHNGYRHIGLMRNGKQVSKLAHRLVAETWLEAPSAAHCVVNHRNKVRDDNRVRNLEWATRSENARHAKRE